MLRRTPNYRAGIYIGCIVLSMMLTLTSFAQNKNLSFRHIGNVTGFRTAIPSVYLKTAAVLCGSVPAMV
jgi:hypothetical protein